MAILASSRLTRLALHDRLFEESANYMIPNPMTLAQLTLDDYNTRFADRHRLQT